jgi:hypothetical protein
MVPAIPISPRITLGDITHESLSDLVELHSRVFPVNYGQKFYNEVLNAGELAKLSNNTCFPTILSSILIVMYKFITTINMQVLSVVE